MLIGCKALWSGTAGLSHLLSHIWYQKLNNRLPKRRFLKERLTTSWYLLQSLVQTSHRVSAGTDTGFLHPLSQFLYVDPDICMVCQCNHKRFPALHFIGFPFTHRKWHLLLLSCFWAVLISSTALCITSLNTVLLFKSRLFSCQQKHFKPQKILEMKYKYTLRAIRKQNQAYSWKKIKKMSLVSYRTFDSIIQRMINEE